ncbi:MAG: Bax inhibitor-1/YccA family protein [Rhodoplanes sp.]
MIFDTAAKPPQPALRTSPAANNRRPRSSSFEPTVSHRCRIAFSSIMRPTYTRSPRTGIPQARVTPPHERDCDSVIVRSVLSFGSARLRPATAHALFWPYAVLVGLSLGAIFMVFTHTSIVRVFFITAASFGALSLWGYTTQRDLSGWGSFLIMGLFGIIIAGLVNLFLQSSALQWAVSVIGVFVFAGLTAWDTQRLKTEYLHAATDGETAERSAILGALSLYLNFLNLFNLLLQSLGQREE